MPGRSYHGEERRHFFRDSDSAGAALEDAAYCLSRAAFHLRNLEAVVRLNLELGRHKRNEKEDKTSKDR